MVKVILITTWVNTPEEKQFDAARLLGAGESMMDVTGESAPVDSPVVVEAWCSEDTATRFEAEYGSAAILKCEVIPDEGI